MTQMSISTRWRPAGELPKARVAARRSPDNPACNGRERFFRCFQVLPGLNRVPLELFHSVEWVR